MNATTPKSRLALALAVLVAALTLVAAGQARLPIEPNPQGPITHQPGRVPTKQKAKKVVKRSLAGHPNGFVHVRVPAEASTE